MSKLAEYRKLIAGLAGMLIPFLNQMGVPLPDFLTIDWINTLLLAATPVLIWFFPNDPSSENASSIARSPAWTILVALLVACLAAGCSGTRSAYKAASEREGLDKAVAIAYVIGEHYTASVRELNDLRTAGRLSPGQLTTLQGIVRDTEPTVQAMIEAAEAAQAFGTAANQAELDAAISAAALALSRLVDQIKLLGSRADLEDPPRLAFA